MSRQPNAWGLSDLLLISVHARVCMLSTYSHLCNCSSHRTSLCAALLVCACARSGTDIFNIGFNAFAQFAQDFHLVDKHSKGCKATHFDGTHARGSDSVPPQNIRDPSARC